MDSMRIDAPAAQKELELLKSLKIGDVRHSQLFPALVVDIEWTCVQIAPTQWSFDGRFCGESLFVAIIEATSTALNLKMVEAR